MVSFVHPWQVVCLLLSGSVPLFLVPGKGKIYLLNATPSIVKKQTEYEII